MRLISISTGKVVPLFGSHHPNYQRVASAINKESISNLDHPLPIEITRLGVSGDEQADPSVHGGIEKAIYAYPIEHYGFWNELLTRETKKLALFTPRFASIGMSVLLIQADVLTHSDCKIAPSQPV